MGFVVSGDPGTGGFNHPFSVALIGGEVTVTKGLVEGMEPAINKVPISGDAKHSQPRLKLNPSDVNEKGESWVCVEVTPYEDGKLDAKSLIEVVHRRTPFRADEKVGRHPLALILWDAEKPRSVFAVTYFNLRYYRTTPAPGGGARRHFFL